MLTPDTLGPWGWPLAITALLSWLVLSIADRRALIRYRKENRHDR